MTQTELRALFDYNAATGHLIWRHRDGVPKQWNVRYAGKIAGHRDASRGYTLIRIEGRVRYLHRLVWVYHGGVPTSCLDHINRDKTDNRIENLRAATHAQNKANVDWEGRGVSFVKRHQKYAAQIVRHGKNHWLGLHETYEAARAAHTAAVLRLDGEFACVSR